MVVLALPRYAVFKNKWNSKYLSYSKDDKFLFFTGDDVLSPEAKFAIEPESRGSGQVHVRSCYNNKYFVRHSSQFVIAGAAKPDEDTTKETCTLLEPLTVNDDDTSTIRFRHVQSGTYACLFNKPSDVQTNARLCAVWNSPNPDKMDAYEVIDWESLVIFPTHNIAFKGSNGSYLGGIWADDVQFLQYSTADKNEANASFRVEPAGDGSVQLYSNNFQRYWQFNNTWIWADRADKSPTDPNLLFWPVKLDSSVIALRSLGNNKYLQGLDADDKTQCLNAWNKKITDDTHITVEALVISRSIYNIFYRKDDARVYNNETPIVCGKAAATNNSDQQDTMEILIKYTEAKSTSWENSVSLEVGLSTTFETGVPYIADGGIEFSATVTGGHTWGGTKDESFEAGVTYKATIGPKTQVEVSYVATKGTCDIPFSYTQADTYSDGSRKITVMNDGLFSGVNCYNFTYVRKETPLQ